MINHILTCHPAVDCPPEGQVSATIKVLPAHSLVLSYCLQSNLHHLSIPEKQRPASVDGLWKHTCFEVFIAIEGDSRYQEFNFSPSGQWASYLFNDYRERRDWHSDHVYALNVEQTETDLQLNVIIPFSELPLIDNSKTLQIGLTAVLEAKDGSRSYWALHHPADEPDFHHRAGFVYTIEPHFF
ncbi:DOMON-like domain-containing protein [Crenothrix sp.]|uniref:DOMON-like domain-containing protein n=1 Tax=Crenothrix sp. TaxID=3100433 RepID=UPI00374DB400